jgi:signal transduction histidine kinase
MTVVVNPATARPTPPSTARIASARVRVELRLFFRERQQVVFSFAYPIVMMVIFGSVLGGDERPGGIPFPQYFLAGIAATGIMLTTFQALATAIASERENGQLERLQLLGTPPVAYFAGKAGQVLVTTAVQLALLLPVARYGFDVPMPAEHRPLADVRLGGGAGRVGRHRPGHRGVGAARQCDVGVHRGLGVRDRAAVLLRGVLRARRDPGLDAAGRRTAPAEVAEPGDALGVPAGRGRRLRTRRGVGTRQDGLRPGCMGDHRPRVLRAHVPLAAGRGMSFVVLRSAAVSSNGGNGGGSPLSERGRRMTLLVLHAVFVVLVAIAVALVLLWDLDGSRALLLTALGVLSLSYLVAGAPGLHSHDRRHRTVYLAVLVAAVGTIAWEEPSLLFLMFLAFPQVWFMVDTVRSGLLWTLVLGIAATVGPIIDWTQGREPLWGPGQTMVGVVFSMAMGIWVLHVLEQSQQRAALIRELRSARAELAGAERERGVLAERERLAREVHDTLAQGYTSIVVLSQTAAAQLSSDVDGARERLALIEEVARDNLAEARAVVAAFSPVALEDSTLVEALERLAERFGRETGLAVRVDTSALAGVVALRRDEEVVLLRGAQEALTNVRRHADARSVVVRLSVTGAAEQRTVSVQVEDDGVGFDPASAPGSGLEGLRGRVIQVGGAVDVASAPGKGTRVTLRVPAVEP